MSGTKLRKNKSYSSALFLNPLIENLNIVEIQTNERMQWQKDREYGRRNYSELGVQRYQRTFGDAMHARDFSRQQQEAMIASGELNKMTSLGMPKSRRSA